MESFKKLTLAAAISTMVVLTGCGGSSGGSSSNTGGGSSATETGVFVDSAVAGINYKTAPGGLQGKTSELGEYDYEPGDTVTFSIGGIDLPAVEATGRITPADMGSGSADWSADPIVVNILRLLQTLDEDGDASNGITITDAVHAALQDVALDPTVSAADFETQANTAINATGKTLIAAQDAIDHFISSQSADLVGSWVYEEANGNVNVLTFLDDGTYLIAHSKADDGDQTAASAEFGEYSWNSATGELTLAVIDESDASGGLNDGVWTMTPDGDALVLSQGDESVTFNAVKNASDGSLVGSWYIGEGMGIHNVLTILDDSHYVIVHNANEEAYNLEVPVAVSSEWGTYTFAGGNFTVTGVSAEQDGPGGLFDSPTVHDGDGPVDGPASLHPTGQLILTDNGGGGSFALRRLGRYVVTLMDFEGDTKQVYVEASGNDFIGGMAQVYSFADIDGGAETVSGVFDMTTSETNEFVVTLNGDGSGYMDFEYVGETNYFDANGWSVLSSGALDYVEVAADDSLGHWTYLPVKGASPYTTLVYLNGTVELMFITELNTPPM